MPSHHHPDFLLIGAPKAGSTSLWRYLRQHPSIYTPDLKEPNFFCDNGGRFPDWSWYDDLFANADDDQVTGEASVAYSLVERNPSTPGRIAEHLPDVRLLYIVRHPLERIESAWQHHIYKRNPVPRDFGVAVQEFRELIEGTLYMRNLNRYREHIPDERIRVLLLSDLADCPDATLQDCDSFLGVDPDRRPPLTMDPQNETDGKTVLPRPVDWLSKNGLSMITASIPDAITAPVKQLIERPLPERPSWPFTAYRHAMHHLRDDAESILTYAGKPNDFWDLSNPSSEE
jgi:hypothetical protein